MISSPDERHARILIVDSDREVLHVFPLVLQQHADVHVARTSREATQQAGKGAFDVIVVGSLIANQSGVELIRTMRRDRRRAQVMVLCERDATEVLAVVIAEGIGDIVVKPFDVAGLPVRIERLLDAMREQERQDEERRALETRVRHADRVTLLGTLVATVAHEVANPLAVVLSNGHLMLEVLEGDETIDAGDRAWLLGAARDSVHAADTMGSYLRRVLHFARKESDSRASSSLREPIETALLFVRPRARDHGVKLHVDDLDNAPEVPHYGVPLTQAVVNALSNAIDASPKDGNVWVTIEESAEEVAVVVRDEGPGLDDEQERRFFEPFYTTKAAGTGLGTVVMQQVLHDHGGRVELVRDARQPGLTIKLVLPLGKVARASGRASVPPR